MAQKSETVPAPVSPPRPQEIRSIPGGGSPEVAPPVPLDKPEIRPAGSVPVRVLPTE